MARQNQKVGDLHDQICLVPPDSGPQDSRWPVGRLPWAGPDVASVFHRGTSIAVSNLKGVTCEDGCGQTTPGRRLNECSRKSDRSAE